MRILFWALILFPLNTFAQQATNSEKFWSQLEQHCGKAYEGWIIEGAVPKDGFTGEKLVMHVRSCKENEIRIPFFVGENKSRTWIIKMNNKKFLSLKHDHRHPDGSEEELSQYGGINSNVGLENLQMFPADEHTAEMLPAASSNVWWFSIDDEIFTYNLRRIGSDKTFTVSFDLTTPIEAPGAPWGY